MLPKKYRLPLRKEVDFFDQAQRFHSSSLTLFVRSTDQLGSQAAIIVPKKHFAQASTRNAVKRQVRSVVTPLLVKYPHLHVVISVKKVVESAQLVTELTRLFYQAARYVSTR